MSRKLIIGLGHKAGVGKDSVAELMKPYGFVRISFADPMKQAAKQIFGLSDDQLWGNTKNIVDPRWGMTPRTIMQRLGDGLRELFGQDLWVKSAQYRIEDSSADKFVITDVRYPNEAEMVKSMGGMVYKVNRNAGIAGNLMAAESAHRSETALDEYSGWDGAINNTGTWAQLESTVENFVCALPLAHTC